MRNKGLKNEGWTTSIGNIKSTLPVSANLSNDFKSVILETDQRKIYPSWG